MKALRDNFRRTFALSRAFAGQRDRRRPLFVPLILLAISLFALQKPAFGGLAENTKLDPGIAAERYALPISPPLDQGDSDLCWVFATLSMLETNYMVRHPGSRIELSRGALQFDSVADRFRRVIRGEAGRPEDGGLAVEAIALIRQMASLIRAISTVSSIPSRFSRPSNRSSPSFPAPRTRKRCWTGS